MLRWEGLYPCWLRRSACTVVQIGKYYIQSTLPAMRCERYNDTTERNVALHWPSSRNWFMKAVRTLTFVTTSLRNGEELAHQLLGGGASTDHMLTSAGRLSLHLVLVVIMHSINYHMRDFDGGCLGLCDSSLHHPLRRSANVPRSP